MWQVINKQKQSLRCAWKYLFSRISQTSQENTCVGFFFSNVAVLKTCNFVKKWLQHRCFPVKFAKFLRTPQGAAYEFFSDGCATIVSVSKYVIISNQCMIVNVWSMAWCCIQSKIMPELDTFSEKKNRAWN